MTDYSDPINKRLTAALLTWSLGIATLPLLLIWFDQDLVSNVLWVWAGLGVLVWIWEHHDGKARIAYINAEMDAIKRLVSAGYKFEDLSPEDAELARAFFARAEGRINE